MNNDDKVINLIKQLIKEAKEELKNKKLITESKSPKEIFDRHLQQERQYITETVLRTINEAKNK